MRIKKNKQAKASPNGKEKFLKQYFHFHFVQFPLWFKNKKVYDDSLKEIYECELNQKCFISSGCHDMKLLLKWK